MNIRARNLQAGKRRGRNAANDFVSIKLWTLFNLIVICAAAFAIANYRIALNQNIAAIEKETARYEQTIHQLDREIASLRVQKEQLSSWTHIRTQIARLGLDLRQPVPHQVQRLAIMRPVADQEFSEAPARKLAMSGRE